MNISKLISFLFLYINLLSGNLINYNLDLISHIEIENASNNYGVSDVWGYTDEFGNEYAIVGYQFGTYIYKVSSTIPQLVADFIGPSSGDYYYHRDYKTYESHLYVVNEMYGGDIGMQVIDLSPLPYNEPIQLETYNEMSQSHNLWIDNVTGLAFIEHQNGDNIHIADISNPSYPQYAASFGNQALNCHDIYTRNNTAYVSEGWSYEFGIYNISDINNIIQLASIPCSGYAHNAWLNDEGTHLITTEETENKTIKIWDISNLNNIMLTGEYLGENNLAHNVHVLNNLLYISHYSTGLKIVDIFNPSRPIEIAAFDTYPQSDNGGYIGCWGAYPFTSNGYIYASDMQNGLYILEFNNTYAGFINGYLYANSEQTLPNSSIKSTLNNKVFYTNDNGYFDFGHPSGTYDFIINNSDTLEITLYPREEANQNLYLDLEFIIGDINQDSEVDIMDVVLAINFIMGNQTPTPQESLYSDINEDSFINIQDIILIVQIILN